MANNLRKPKHLDMGLTYVAVDTGDAFLAGLDNSMLSLGSALDVAYDANSSGDSRAVKQMLLCAIARHHAVADLLKGYVEANENDRKSGQAGA